MKDCMAGNNGCLI